MSTVSLFGRTTFRGVGFILEVLIHVPVSPTSYVFSTSSIAFTLSLHSSAQGSSVFTLSNCWHSHIQRYFCVLLSDGLFSLTLFGCPLNKVQKQSEEQIAVYKVSDSNCSMGSYSEFYSLFVMKWLDGNKLFTCIYVFLIAFQTKTLIISEVNETRRPDKQH